MCKTEKNQPPRQEELMDEELLKLGVRFKDLTQTKNNSSETTATISDHAAEDFRSEKAKPGKLGAALISWSSLVAADGLLIFMCLADKIELSYGLVFLAAASAILGGRASRARL